MNFFLFAAGLGQRLRPLTLNTPKSLIEIGQQPIIGRLLKQILPHAQQVFINISWLGEQIETYIHQHFSHENIILLKEKSPLETGGALLNAFSYEREHRLSTRLNQDPFIIINTDIYTDYSFAKLKQKITLLSSTTLGHLVLVDCPKGRRQGDFQLINGRIIGSMETRGNLVYSGIALIHPKLIHHYQHSLPTHIRDEAFFSLSQVFYHANEHNLLSGEYFTGQWSDIGTLESLQALIQSLHQ